MVGHWSLPFLLGFALALALGPSARPLMATAWNALANLGFALFGSAPSSLENFDSRERYPEPREPGRGRYLDEGEVRPRER